MEHEKKQMPLIQEKVRELYESRGWDTDPSLLLIGAMEELGEIAGRWLAEHPGYEKSLEGTDPISEEVGDLMLLILAFCNTQGIDFEEAVGRTIEKRRR